VSLAANVAAAPTLAWQPVMVAGWPPVALLLAVELFGHRPSRREPSETELSKSATGRDRETGGGSGAVIIPSAVSQIAQTSTSTSTEQPTAQEIMWEHFLHVQAGGRTPTGAELDRAAGTNNYGSRVLRQRREEGRIRPEGAIAPTEAITANSYTVPLPPPC
jgi:hypothetical protein